MFVYYRKPLLLMSPPLSYHAQMCTHKHSGIKGYQPRIVVEKSKQCFELWASRTVSMSQQIDRDTHIGLPCSCSVLTLSNEIEERFFVFDKLVSAMPFPYHCNVFPHRFIQAFTLVLEASIKHLIIRLMDHMQYGTKEIYAVQNVARQCARFHFVRNCSQFIIIQITGTYTHSNSNE